MAFDRDKMTIGQVASAQIKSITTMPSLLSESQSTSTQGHVPVPYIRESALQLWRSLQSNATTQVHSEAAHNQQEAVQLTTSIHKHPKATPRSILKTAQPFIKDVASPLTSDVIVSDYRMVFTKQFASPNPAKRVRLCKDASEEEWRIYFRTWVEEFRIRGKTNGNKKLVKKAIARMSRSEKRWAERDKLWEAGDQEPLGEMAPDAMENHLQDFEQQKIEEEQVRKARERTRQIKEAKRKARGRKKMRDKLKDLAQGLGESPRGGGPLVC